MAAHAEADLVIGGLARDFPRRIRLERNVILTMFNKHSGRILGVVTFAAALYLATPSSSGVSDDSSDRPLKRVETAEVVAASSSRELRFSGITRAVRRARLSFSLGGRLVSRGVDVGDRVRKGRILARLDDLEVENALATARGTVSELAARRAQAERDLARAEQLLAAKAATGEEVEKTRAGLEALSAAEQAAMARLRETERLRGETMLKAPFDGTVTEVLFEPGEYVSPGKSVVMLSGDGDLELEVEVPETVIAGIAVGDEVVVSMPHRSGSEVTTRVTSVGRTASGPGSLFPVVARLPAGDGRPVGAGAELVFSLANKQTLAVPVEAVINPGGRRPSVFVLRSSDEGLRAHRVWIEVGELVGRSVVVSGELQVGDSVVSGGQRGLLDGEPVEAVAGDL